MTKNLTKKFLWTWKATNGPALKAEYKFHPFRKWRFDFAREKSQTAIEIEGGIWSGGRHIHPAGFEKDAEKYNEAVMMGWKVFRLTPGMISIPYIERLVADITKRESIW